MFFRIVLGGLAEDIAAAILKAFVGALTASIPGMGTAIALATTISPLLLHTEPMASYQNPAVIHAWQVMAVAANALLVLVIVGGGLQIMIGRTTGTTYVPVHEFIPRLLLGVLAINASLLWAQILIDIENGLCHLTFFNIVDFFTQVNQKITGRPPDGAALVFVLAILSVVFVIVFIIQIFTIIERLALLNLLIVLAPLGVLLWLLPQTQPWAAFWSRMFAITVFVQFFQLLAFSLGASFILNLMNTTQDPVLALILAIGVMLLIGHIPRYMYRFGMTAGSMGGGNPLGGLIRTAISVAAIFA
jgi:hypothetical protein